MTPQIRHCIFTLNINNNNTNNDNITFELQCLFGRLYKSFRDKCCTKNLIKLLNTNHNQFNDIQELLRILCDEISRTLSRYNKPDVINNLCKGIMHKIYIYIDTLI